MHEVVIGICSFRRAHLAETLASCARLESPEGLRVTVMVADNDDTESAKPLVDAFTGFPFGLVYLHAPARNISVARNAILTAARASGARRLCFLDDDETVAPDWLCAVTKRMTEGRAEVVLGPVRAAYRDDAPRWLRKSRLHDTEPVVLADGTIQTGYTCNVMVDLTSSAVAAVRFDLSLGRTGGEDTAFFHEIWTRGGRFDFAPDAPAFEVVPQDRASLAWLLKRRYRMGQSHGRQLALGQTGTRKAVEVARAGAKALACCGLALTRLHRPDRAAHALMRATLHLGVISFLGGFRLVEPYGESSPSQTMVP